MPKLSGGSRSKINLVANTLSENEYDQESCEHAHGQPICYEAPTDSIFNSKQT